MRASKERICVCGVEEEEEEEDEDCGGKEEEGGGGCADVTDETKRAEEVRAFIRKCDPVVTGREGHARNSRALIRLNNRTMKGRL